MRAYCSFHDPRAVVSTIMMMLKNEFLVGKIGFDTAENEPDLRVKLRKKKKY